MVFFSSPSFGRRTRSEQRLGCGHNLGVRPQDHGAAFAGSILSQKHEGWSALPEMYDDGGISGATMERPALKRLLSDIDTQRVGIRTHGMLLRTSLNFRSNFSLLVFENSAPNGLFVLDFCAQGSGTVVRSRNGTGSALRRRTGSYPCRAWGGGRPRKGRGPRRRNTL